MNISILGSTGSVGTQSLEVIGRFPEKFKVVGLTANKDIITLKKQIDMFRPSAVAVMDDEKAEILKKEVDTEVYSGMQGLKKIAALKEADRVINSLVGSVGIIPTVEAIRHKKDIALANKEALVAAGSVVMPLAKKFGVHIIPIDSEHSAILQCLKGESASGISKLILTCSGGPFKNSSKGHLKGVKASDALKHPTWDMGAKITIDSATLMNKGFEVIEAHWLYSISYKDIEVVIHPQSIIHSMVEFKDRSVIAQLGMPDMRLPIQYALSCPERLENKSLPQLDIAAVKELSFDKPNLELFPCLKYAYDAGIAGGTFPAAINAANEAAVDYFLKGKIGFLDIPWLIKRALDSHSAIKNPSVNDILNTDKKTKEQIKKELEE